MNRRQYLKKNTALASGLILGHWTIATAFHQELKHQLIREIHLQTVTEISKMIQFYSGQLGFEILFKEEHKCSFKTGNSILTFSRIENSAKPHYHFAFNLSEQKISLAENWLKSKKVEIIAPPTSLTQVPEFSKDVVYFAHWDAHAIFFYDPAGNVVELIARHTLRDDRKGDFSLEDIHFISEIALVTDRVPELSNEITTALHLKTYSGQSNTFAAIGNEAGLILCFQLGGAAAFGKGRKRQSYETKIKLTDHFNGPKFNNKNFRIQ